ncbi:MAG: hypothetical protein AYK19_17860 [Theionarchaea archaeon DG-70-1]|nr:MAG: hypothetical protein AYK19_17860 [Theionarchaea archaeon DG-70-1]
MIKEVFPYPYIQRTAKGILKVPDTITQVIKFLVLLPVDLTNFFTAFQNEKRLTTYVTRVTT